MRIGAFTTFAPEYTFPEACQLIKAIGYEGVQPRIVPDASASFDAGKPFNPWGNNKGGLKESDFFADPKGTLKPAVDAGLEITSVASYTNTDDMDRALNMVKACSAAGIKNVRIGAAKLPKENNYDVHKLIDAARGRYVELVAEAKKAGVRPCLELHGGTPFPGPSGTVNFLKAFDPSEVGILYDPANMLSDGWETVDLSFNLMGPYLAEIHVKDAKWVETDEVDAHGCKTWKVVNADLHEGIVNWAHVVDTARKHGYDGWLVEEGHTETPTHKRLAEAYALLKKLAG